MKIQSIIAAAALAVLACACAPKGSYGNPDAQQVYIGENIAVAPTQYGKVRGFIMRDIYCFRGIPYGGDTSGENRFMPPTAPESWEGVRPCVFWPASSPQDFYDRTTQSYGAFVDHWNYDVLSEDCLGLNLWTPALGDGAKRPVLVWLHGGGFSRGNGIEQDGYDGENISRYGDIVYVSVNHRLGPLGYADFAAVGGEEFAHSGNVGMLDIVAALQWVHDNIEAFGGDPDNVTVMGQSGGGSKVCMVCTMPSAKGLVHKGVALSGNSTRGNSKEYAEALGAEIFKLAGGDMKKLQQMPWEEYFKIAFQAQGNIASIKGQRGGFSPVSDGLDLPENFFDPEDASVPDVPMLFCSTFHEWNLDRDNPEMEEWTADDAVKYMERSYGPRSREIFEAYANLFPEASPVEIVTMIGSSRSGVVNSANVKSAQKSPVYMAWFGMGSPLFDGRHRAFHCSDISFWFLNTDLMITHTGGGKRPRTLSYKMADALLAFMRTGNPNCKALPAWPEYNPEEGMTMVLNEKCEALPDPDRAARKVLESARN